MWGGAVGRCGLISVRRGVGRCRCGGFFVCFAVEPRYHFLVLADNILTLFELSFIQLEGALELLDGALCLFVSDLLL